MMTGLSRHASADLRVGILSPGQLATYMCDPIPLSPHGALFEAGAVTGAAVILP